MKKTDRNAKIEENLTERINALPLVFQQILVSDLHEALKNRLPILEKALVELNNQHLKIDCDTIELKAFSRDTNKAMEKAFPYVFSQYKTDKNAKTKIS